MTSLTKRRYAESIIGIDLDNTLISYDRLFMRLALERGLIPSDYPENKQGIRDHVRGLPDGEFHWRSLQAQVYGPAISGGLLAPGALDFIRAARKHGAGLAIVSHKTKFSNLGHGTFDLHAAATQWLEERGVIGPDTVGPECVYFEPTREAKIARIVTLRCTHFIDDLHEVFEEADFPRAVEALLLGVAPAATASWYRHVPSFAEIAGLFEN